MDYGLSERKALKFPVIYIASLVVWLNTHAFGQPAYIRPFLAYTADVGGNFTGGTKQKGSYMGLVDAGILLNSDSLRWWEGGVVNLEVISSHGKGISSTVIHDIQGISNIEAGNHAFVFWEAWYHQQFGKLGLRFGLQNVNSDFMSQPFAADFSGSSYSVFPTLSLNYSLPNYPVAGLGLTFSYVWNANWNLLCAVFDGKVPELQKNTVNIHWRANLKKDGVLALSEVKYTSGDKAALAATYGLGIGLHTSRFPDVKNETRLHKRNYTFYAFGEHDIIQMGKKNAGLFLQLSYADKDRNSVWLYTAAGVVGNGFFTGKQTDKAGIGLSQLYYHTSTGTDKIKNNRESTLEAYVQFQVTRQLSVKPGLFTIFSTEKKTVLASMVRFNFQLNP